MVTGSPVVKGGSGFGACHDTSVTTDVYSSSTGIETRRDRITVPEDTPGIATDATNRHSTFANDVQDDIYEEGLRSLLPDGFQPGKLDHDDVREDAQWRHIGGRNHIWRSWLRGSYYVDSRHSIWEWDREQRLERTQR
jgi:hypothetical protein